MMGRVLLLALLEATLVLLGGAQQFPARAGQGS